MHTMVKGALNNPAYLDVATILLQAITGVKPVMHRARQSIATFGLRVNTPISLTCTMRGDDAWMFVDKCVNLVFPRIKDWAGVKGMGVSSIT